MRRPDTAFLPHLGIPAAIVVAILLQIRGPQFRVWVLTGFAALLGLELLLIIGNEYLKFDDLHSLKPRLLDTILVCGIFVGILGASRTADTIQACLACLAVVLLALVFWELYTMRHGYTSYFQLPAVGTLTLIDLRDARHSEGSPQDVVWHWQEYQWWLSVDVVFLLVDGLSLLGWWLHILPADTIATLILIIAPGVIIFNIVRYALLDRNIKRLHMEGGRHSEPSPG